MSDLAPILQSFFTDRMITQKHASEHTIRSYRDTWRLLLAFAQDATGTPVWKLDIGQLDAGLITDFLRWLETSRGCSPATLNARLSAIRSLFRYAALRAPDNAASWPSRPAGRTRRSSAGSPTTKPTPCWPSPTGRPGPGAATTPSCSPRSVPGCACPSSPSSSARTSAWAPERMSTAQARAGRNGARRSTPRPSQRSARGWPGSPAATATRCSSPGAEPRCPATRSTPGSPGISRPQRNPARRWPTRTSHLIP